MKDMEEDVLGKVPLRQQPRGALAKDRHPSSVHARSPWLNKVVRQPSDVDPALPGELDELTVVVVEVTLQVSPPEAERAI